MLPFLHILIRVEEDGSLHALGAFTTKERQLAYQKAAELEDNQIRLDYYNGPFDSDIRVIYAGHRQWNMDRFQLGGYFKSEGEAWNSVTQDGYVSVMRIDATYEEEKQFEREALELYAKIQKKWRLTSYEDLISREGAEKARANIMLRFYEDTLESFKPKTKRDVRALYGIIVAILLLPAAIFYYASSGPSWGENLNSVKWLPSYATNISFYKSKQVNVYEFKVSVDNFRTWAQSSGFDLKPIRQPQVVSRYRAYIPTKRDEFQVTTTKQESGSRAEEITPEMMEAWQRTIGVTVETGFYASGPNGITALYDPVSRKAYYEEIVSF